MRMYGRRAMLNRPGYESTAAIVAEVVENKGYGKEPEPFWDVMLQISDCSRTICLSLRDPADPETDDEQFENDMHKLDTIIDCVYELQKGMRKVRRLYR
jgi:hypothetical protein